MSASQQVEVLSAHPFFAAIVGVAVQGELRLREPAAQCFGIDAQATTRLGHRDNDHGSTPFVWDRQHEREPAARTPGNFPRKPPWKMPRSRPGGSLKRVSQLWRGGDDDSSPPNTGGCVATKTSDR